MTRPTRFTLAAIVLFIMFAFSVAGGIDLAVERTIEEQKQYPPSAVDRSWKERFGKRHPPYPSTASTILRSLTDEHCPPLDGETLPIVTLHIRTQADNKTEVSGCTRYARRPFVPRRGAVKQMAAR